MAKLEYKFASFEVKADSAGDGSEFEGRGACFLNVDHGGDMLAPTCYDGQLDQFITNGVVRAEHEVTTGKIVDAQITDNALVIKGKVLPTTAGNDQKILLKAGAVKSLSIGHYILARQYLETPDQIKTVWDQYSYTPGPDEAMQAASMLPIRLVTKAQPVEVSTTFMPMNDRAYILSVKSGPPGGQTLDHHFDSVLDSVSELRSRVESFLAVKQADGKTLQPNRRAQVRAVRDSFDKILLAMESKSNVSATDDLIYQFEHARAILNSVML
jgi:hypothetical protein